MLTAGMTHVVLESTSHGLAQHRVTGCEFDIAVVTNITHEHLDYHKTYEGYRFAKGSLFRMLEDTNVKSHGNPRLAVLNKDDISYEYLHGISGRNQRSYGLEGDADIRADEVRYSPSGLEFQIHSSAWTQPVRCNLVGTYNISNCLAAFTAAVEGVHISPQVAAEGIAALKTLPGRIGTNQPGTELQRHCRFCTHPQRPASRSGNFPPDDHRPVDHRFWFGRPAGPRKASFDGGSISAICRYFHYDGGRSPHRVPIWHSG